MSPRWWVYDRVVDLHYGNRHQAAIAGWIWRHFGRLWLIP